MDFPASFSPAEQLQLIEAPPCADTHVPGPPYYTWATRTGLLRAVGTGGTRQLASGPHAQYVRRTRTSLGRTVHEYVPRTVAPQALTDEPTRQQCMLRWIQRLARPLSADATDAGAAAIVRLAAIARVSSALLGEPLGE